MYLLIRSSKHFSLFTARNFITSFRGDGGGCVQYIVVGSKFFLPHEKYFTSRLNPNTVAYVSKFKFIAVDNLILCCTECFYGLLARFGLAVCVCASHPFREYGMEGGKIANIHYCLCVNL